jgi:hypothetical protein
MTYSDEPSDEAGALAFTEAYLIPTQPGTHLSTQHLNLYLPVDT